MTADIATELFTPMLACDGLDNASEAAFIVKGAEIAWSADAIRVARALPSLIVGVVDDVDKPGGAPAIADVIVQDDGELERVTSTFATNPHAAISLALLLRASEVRDINDGLAAESAVYSMLQSGPEFAAWRADHAVRQRPQPAEGAVRTTRDGGRLLITLSRPGVRNALDARMRDDLLEALFVAAADPSLTSVVVSGEGPTFCSGGYLDEFGSRPDPASAHLVRLTRSIGRVISELAPRTTFLVHGDCRGSGVELAAFAGRVIARPGSTFGLPEVSLGLIPGAGGTVSLPRRIGRHRTALLALRGDPVDVDTARRWGLVDDIVDE